MEATYQRTEDVVLREIAGEAILVPIQGHIADLRRIFSLDPVGRFIWDRLDRPVTVAALAAALQASYDVAADTAAADAGRFVGELCEAGLARSLP